MKTKLTSLLALAACFLSFQTFAQDPDTPPASQAANSGNANLLLPGSFKVDPDFFPKNEISYKVFATANGAKTDLGVIKERYVTDNKKGTLTIIKVQENDKQKVTDTSIVKLESLGFVYHSTTDKNKKVFQNYTNPGKDPDAKYFDAGAISNLLAILPQEKMQPVAIPVYDLTQHANANFSLMNVKDDMGYGGVNSDAGIFVVDLMAGSNHHRYVINKATHLAEIIEIDSADGSKTEWKLSK